MHPRALLAERGLRPKKRFGQNFLMDAGIARRIAALAFDDDVERVVEVGAGTGALTVALAARGANVTAIEIDPELVPILCARAELERVEIVSADALDIDYRALAHGDDWIGAGNLPYNIATELLLRWAALDRPPRRIVAMVQREVADRILAQPSTPAYGSLTLALSFSMTARRAMNVPPAAFFPQPKVDSTVVVLERRSEPSVAVGDSAMLLQVVRAGFAYRRKTLANSLALGLDRSRSEIARALDAAAIEPETRGEQLTLADFARVADRLAR